MPEEQAPEETQETPPTPASGPDDGTPAEPESQEEGSQPQTDNWQERAERAEKRAEDLHGLTTRAQQEAAQYRQIVELAREGDPEAMEALGWSPVDTEQDEEDLDADEPMTRAEFKAWQEEQQSHWAQEQEATQLEELESQFIEQEIGRLEEEGDQQFSDSYKRILVATAFDFADDDGIPDFNTAKKELQAEMEADRKRYVKSKNTPQAPSGAAGQENIDLDDDAKRREYMARRYTESQQST